MGEGWGMQGSVRSPESDSARPRSVSLSSRNINTHESPAEEGRRAAVEGEKHTHKSVKKKKQTPNHELSNGNYY